MAQTVQRLRGQGMDLTAEQVAAERARAYLAVKLQTGTGRLVVWTPEETAALWASIVGEEVTA